MLPKMIALSFVALMAIGLYCWLDPSTYWEKATFPLVAVLMIGVTAQAIDKLIED